MKRDYGSCVKANLIRPIEKLDDKSAEIVALVKHKIETADIPLVLHQWNSACSRTSMTS